MKLEFDVGTKEKHKVDFSFDKMWGGVIFNVDGKEVMKKRLIASVSLSMKYNITVGNKEKHEVMVEMVRPLLFAGLRKSWKYNAYVDGKLVKSTKD